MPVAEGRVLFFDSIAEQGRDPFREACERDLEGIVAKWTHGTYQTDTRRTSWLKIKNAEYSQMVGTSHELFEAGEVRPRRPLPKAATLALV
jgi:ATP-dependent DNA ligase